MSQQIGSKENTEQLKEVARRRQWQKPLLFEVTLLKLSSMYLCREPEYITVFLCSLSQGCPSLLAMVPSQLRPGSSAVLLVHIFNLPTAMPMPASTWALTHCCGPTWTFQGFLTLVPCIRLGHYSHPWPDASQEVPDACTLLCSMPMGGTGPRAGRNMLLCM